MFKHPQNKLEVLPKNSSLRVRMDAYITLISGATGRLHPGFGPNGFLLRLSAHHRLHRTRDATVTQAGASPLFSNSSVTYQGLSLVEMLLRFSLAS